MNDDKKLVCEVKDKVLDLLRQANKTREFSMGDVDFLYKATKTVKNACEIEGMMDEQGYSQDGGPMDWGDTQGRRYRRGRDGRGRNGYSRDDGRSEMLKHLEMAWDAAPEQYREDILRMKKRLEND